MLIQASNSDQQFILSLRVEQTTLSNCWKNILQLLFHHVWKAYNLLTHIMTSKTYVFPFPSLAVSNIK